MKKLSFPMLRVLKHLKNGDPVYQHCRRQADYGGLTGTLFALLKRGLISDKGDDYSLTAAGMEALEKERKTTC